MDAASSKQVPSRAWLLPVLLALSFSAAFGNALLYADRAAIPLVVSDAWYFVDAFVRKDVDGTLRWHDLLVKRSADDHSQPLNKVLLKVNRHYFDLDFWAEALIAVIAGTFFSAILVLIAAYRMDWRHSSWSEGVALALVPIATLSLNSTAIYTWSLVGLFFLSLPLVILLFAAGTFAATRVAVGTLFCSALLALLLQDNAAILALAACAALLILRGLRFKRIGGTVPMLLGLVAALLCFKILAWSVGHGELESSVSTVDRLTRLLGELSQAWKWVIIPATASVIHPTHYLSALPSAATTITVLIGLVVVVVHVSFWISSWRSLDRTITMVAAGLMLYAYSLTAAVVLARVGEFGSDYLYQHRYVAFYQLANLSILMQLVVAARNRGDEQNASRRRSGFSNPRRMGQVLVLSALLVFAGIQTVLSINSWLEVRYVRSYSASIATAMYCLAANPDVVKPVCPATLTVCGYQPDIRNDLIGLLKEHKLNLFSPAFQQRHRLFPPADPPDTCLPKE